MLSPVFRPPFLPLPSGDLESAHCERLAQHLTRCVEGASETAMRPIVAWLERQPVRHQDFGPFQPQELTHALSEYVAPASTDTFVDGRSLAEYRAMKALAPLESLATYPAFCDELMHLAGNACGRAMAFRRSEISTVADRWGQRVSYPGPEDLVPLLKHLHAYWYRHLNTGPGTAAVAILAGLAHVHPFEDGNGRVARMLFNATLQRRSHTPVYLPIYELAALSRCGFLLRLRQAQYHGEWEPLLGFLVHGAEKLLVRPAGYS
jgi:hypothetical protein